MSTFILIENDDQTEVIEIVPFVPGVSVTLSESYEAINDVTEYPVEEGANISDHIRLGLESLLIEIFVSRTPITEDFFAGNGAYSSIKLEVPTPFDPLSEGAPPAGSLGFVVRSAVATLEGRVFPPIIFANVLTFDEYDPPKEALQKLTEIRQSKALVRVITSVREYENMALVSMNATRTAQEGSGIRIVLGFRQVRTVSTDTVLAAPVPSEPRGFGASNKGAQPPNSLPNPLGGPSGPERNRSLFLEALEAAGVAP